MCPFCACRAPAHLQTHPMFGETVLAIDPGVAVAAAAAMRGGRVVFSASAALAGPPAEWFDLARPARVVVEAQRLDHGRCAFVEGLVHGLAAGRGVPCHRHVPRAMHAACAAFGGHARNKRRAVAIVRRLLPPADIALLRAASPRGRADPFDAALFLLWHARPAAVAAGGSRAGVERALAVYK